MRKLSSLQMTGPKDAALISEVASEDAVRRALIEQQLHTWFQPRLNLRTGQVCGVEVSGRWLHPFKGVLSPLSFIPVLERCGLMDEFLFTQLDEALSVQQIAGKHGISLNMAFRLQASQVASIQLTSTIRDALNWYSSWPSALTFEIAEDVLLSSSVTSLKSLMKLRNMGCLLSIGTFNAVFLPLQRLYQRFFKEIRLDAFFLRSMEHEFNSQAAISSTLAFGKTAGMSVVIEGVNTELQHQQLLALGGTQAQGAWYAPPMSGKELMQWLQLRVQSHTPFKGSIDPPLGGRAGRSRMPASF